MHLSVFANLSINKRVADAITSSRVAASFVFCVVYIATTSGEHFAGQMIPISFLVP